LEFAMDRPLIGHRVLICDRDAKWSAPVRARLNEAGIRVVQTPYRAPNANAYAERFVHSINGVSRSLDSDSRGVMTGEGGFGGSTEERDITSSARSSPNVQALFVTSQM
jgi:hypothetical protein